MDFKILAGLNEAANSEHYRSTVEKLKKLDQTEKLELLDLACGSMIALRPQLSRAALITLIGLFCHHLDSNPKNNPEVEAALKTVKDQIQAATHIADRKQCLLLLRTLATAISLKNSPTHSRDVETFRNCHHQLKQYRAWHSLVAALQHFFSKLFPTLSTSAASHFARKQIPDSLSSLRKILATPKQVYTYPGQYAFPLSGGLSACTPISYTIAAEIAELSNDDFEQLCSGKFDNQRAAQQFGECTRQGCKLQRATSRFWRFGNAPWNIERYPNLDAGRFPAVYRLISNYPDYQSRKSLIDSLQKSSSHTIAGAICGETHTIGFVSRQVGEKKMYILADSKHGFWSGKLRQGKLEVYDNWQAAGQRILNKFDGQHDDLICTYTHKVAKK